MKKIWITTLAALTLTAGSAAAQDWTDLFKKAAAEQLDKATDGKLTEQVLLREWTYAAPGVKFEGDDLTAKLGASFLESTVREQLESIYKMAGVVPGSCHVTFTRDNRFTATDGKHEAGGDFTYDAATHEIEMTLRSHNAAEIEQRLAERERREEKYLSEEARAEIDRRREERKKKYADKIKPIGITGHIYLNGERLQLLFPMSRLLEIVQSLDKENKLEKYQTLIDAFKKYKSLYVGFEFTK